MNKTQLFLFLLATAILAAIYLIVKSLCPALDAWLSVPIVDNFNFKIVRYGPVCLFAFFIIIFVLNLFSFLFPDKTKKSAASAE